MTLYYILHITWSVAGIGYILNSSHTPSTRWAWVLAMIICPPIATLLFWLTTLRDTHCATISHLPHYNRLQRTILTLTECAITTRNHTTALHNAEATFSCIIRDLQHARHEIIFEYYIIDNDYLGSTIISLLCRRARAGVKVKITYDAIGSWRLNRTLLNKMRESGIELHCFGKPYFPFLRPSCHRRNHRKMVIIDRHILYLGGINIASRYLGKGDMGFWRDDHIRIEGEAAYKAALNSQPSTKCNIKRQHISSLCPMQLIFTTEKTPARALEYILIEALASARHTIRISSPYFLPPASLLDAICSAAQSGIEVTLLLPKKCDVAIVHHASMPALRRCANCGVNIFNYTAGFLHSKIIIIDEATTIVGSANIDYRSLYYNYESAVAIYHKPTAHHYTEQMMRDIKNARPIEPQELQSSTLNRIKEGAAQLLAPLL